MSDGEPQFRLQTLGGLALYRAGEEEPRIQNAKALALVAFLALTPDHQARRPYLAHLFWPDTDRDKRLRSLRQALYYLTDRAGRDLFRREEGVLALREDCLEVDLWTFDRALEADDYEAVTEVYEGAFLEGFDGNVSREFEHWREAETERIWSGLKLAYRELIEEYLEAERPATALRYAREYRDLNPLDETARQLVVRVLVADNREVEAYQEYQQYATLLEEELEDAPSEEFEAKAGEVRELLLEHHAARDDGGNEFPLRGRDSRSYRASLLRTGVLATGILFVLGLLWALDEPQSARSSDGAFRSVTADVILQRQGTERQWLVQLRGGTVAGGTSTDRAQNAIGRPGHTGQVAVTVPSASGVNVSLVNPTTNDTTQLTDRPYDEHPLAFSPDGRYLAYNFGVEARDGERYDLYAGIHNLETGRQRLLVSGDTLTTIKQADWSPYGPRLALSARPVGGQRDIWRISADGKRLQRLTRHSTPDVDPAWSPEANWIAFTSHRTRNPDVFIVRPDGTELRQISRHPEADRSPVWLSPNHLAFVSERGNGPDLWGLYLPTGKRKQLTNRGDVRGAIEVDRREPGRWIDSVDIRPSREYAIPGEYLRFRARLYDVRGRQHTDGSPSLRWTVTKSNQLVPLRSSDLYRVRQTEPGPAEVRVSAGGWRADTVRLKPASIQQRRVSALLRESWTGQPLDENWIPLGEPQPKVYRDAEGRFHTVVDPNGDAHFDSGLAYSEAISLRKGITVTVWARAIFTQPLYQALKVSLVPDRPSAGNPSWGPPSSAIRFTLSPYNPPFRVRSPTTRVQLPLSVSPNQWHQYSVQITPNGAVWALVDGKLLWRSPPSPNTDLMEDAYLVLYGRSEQTEILFGPTTVYDGTRYRLVTRTQN